MATIRTWTINRKSLLLATAVLLSLSMACCKKDTCQSVFGEGGVIDLSLPEYYDLNTIGNAVVINRGHKGIVITQLTNNTFVAFECACPNDNDQRMLATDDWGYSILTCHICGAQYNSLDGTPITASISACMLYEYSTSIDSQMLYVW